MSVQVIVSVPSSLPPGARLRAYGNFGASLSGEQLLNSSEPAVHRPGELAGDAGYGYDRFGVDPFGGPAASAGWDEGRFGHAFDAVSRAIAIELDELYGYGAFTVGVRPVNAQGEESADPVVEATTFIAEPPLPLDNHAFASFNAGTGVATFSVGLATL